MAHFAKLSDENIVLSIEVVADTDTQNSEGVETESVGVQFLNALHGWPHWKQTSYNTFAGKHYNGKVLSDDQTKAFRKNFATVGYKYDSTKDAFIPPQPYSSHTLNETTCQWDPPISPPTNFFYEGDTDPLNSQWDESNLRWICPKPSDPSVTYVWNPSTSLWEILS